MAHSILIVDDQRDVIRLLESALASLGHPFIITSARSGEQGLMEARLGSVDLLVADVRLPGMTGLELLSRIRKLRPAIRSILITGVPDLDLRAAAAQAGADACFQKPIPIADFLDAVKTVLGLAAAGPPVPPAAAPDESSDSPISDRVAQLRQVLKADSVSLLDENAVVLVRAGELPGSEMGDSFLPSLMSAYSSGRKVSLSLGRVQAENMYFFYGEEFGLIVAPVRDAYALVVAVEQPMEAGRAARFYLLVDEARKDIGGLLEKMGLPAPAIEEAPAAAFYGSIEEQEMPEASGLDNQLENLLGRKPPGRLKQDAEAFWEPDEDLAGTGVLSADALSYEQALQLGIAPEDEGKH